MAGFKKEKPSARANYPKLHASDPLAGFDAATREKVSEMETYIMKNCLWQFNSRGWDRRKQNEGILGKTAQLLVGEEVQNETPLDKCYWVDAVLLSRAFREHCVWLAGMGKDEVLALLKILHARIDWLTIDGSLNEELTVQNY
ncbi:Fe-only nitrogenase subunit delta [Rhodoblastus sphagnicola]|uniref:Nitrogenase iron-iron protein delta chain n=1 Tax=Rhodoblastus sphagnicola TaxID=333368 RepID=A0A2S6N9K2_9HYPH|nr:Fe-only nitrogenase subunit delta [Rhodoblastus sphagnicola]MBB4200421.1 nitrogenase delta subunit [Rhodoblastus sphagnicola]PPQ31298.1 Fe-only nitrogenase subunit delta [Rhodoblastus sphagnicola]